MCKKTIQHTLKITLDCSQELKISQTLASNTNDNHSQTQDKSTSKENDNDLFIDAWLDRPRPYLRIVNRMTGNICLQVEGENLEELREQGALDSSDLYSTEPWLIKEQVHQLFLMCYALATHSGTTRLK